MKMAIVHDWLTVYAGAERVLEQIVQLYPDSELFSLIDFLPDNGRHFILEKKVITSFIQKLPFANKNYRNYLPLMPLAIERFDLSNYDLVISSSHAVAKGVVTRDHQLHICYCHTPIRYAWELRDQYLKEANLDKGLKCLVARTILGYIRAWDRKTINRVSHFIASSNYIAERIRRIYGREAAVIYPPVDTKKFQLQTGKEDFFLAASRMVPYKKMDMVVDAFSQMPDKRLVVIGDGPEFVKAKKRAGNNVELRGYQNSDVLKDYLQKARGFVFAAEEDFGILPVEAMACGTPVIAYGKGGVTETVVPCNQRSEARGQRSEARGQRSEVGGQRSEIRGRRSEEAPTGVFFYEQTPEALIGAVRQFEKIEDRFDPSMIRINAERFNKERFKREFKGFVEEKWLEFRSKLKD